MEGTYKEKRREWIEGGDETTQLVASYPYNLSRYTRNSFLRVGYCEDRAPPAREPPRFAPVTNNASSSDRVRTERARTVSFGQISRPISTLSRIIFLRCLSSQIFIYNLIARYPNSATLFLMDGWIVRVKHPCGCIFDKIQML